MSLRLRRVLGAGLAAGLLVGLAASSTASAAATIRFKADYGSQCVTVYGPVGATGSVTLQTSSGSPIETMPLDLASDDFQQRCLQTDPMAGMRLRATLNGVTRTWTLPKLSVRIDRATDVARGVGPAGKTIHIRVSYRSGFAGSTSKDTSTTASSTGTWSRDLTTLRNIRGGDAITVSNQDAAGDVITASEVAPRLYIWIGRAKFGGQMMTGSGGTVTLRTSSGTFRASGGISWNEGQSTGFNDTSLFTNAGTPKTVRVGDRISSSIASDMSFTVPNLTIAVDTAANLLTGSCVAGRPIAVSVVNGGGTKFGAEATCAAGGAFSFDTTATYDIVANDRVQVALRVARGDVFLRRVVAQ